MGLDIVELVMEVEERFDTSISDDEASAIVTMGQLADCLVAKARATKKEVCPTSSAFYDVRRVLTAEFGIARSKIRPTTTMASLFPWTRRRRHWKRFTACFRGKLPRLRWPTPVRLAFASVCLAPVVLSLLIFYALPEPEYDGMIWLPLLLMPCFVLAGLVVLRPLAVVVPSEAATVGDCARRFAQYNHLRTDRDESELEAWIWNELVDIVSAMFAIDRRTIRRESQLYRDLGLG